MAAQMTFQRYELKYLLSPAQKQAVLQAMDGHMELDQYRQDQLSLCSEVYGTPILSPGQTLMEIKTSGGIPLWMVHALTQHNIFKTSFSKYGTAYQHMTKQQQLGGLCYA